MLNKKSLVFLLFVNSIIAQTVSKDSTKTNSLENVVVTAQFSPQSVKKSVFNVRVISEQDIKNLSAYNLTDVLNQYLNITLQPSGSSGRSSVSLFGLDGQYFKIFVDNVPLVNENGLGNNIDLSQINLNDIERIEIVEGSMGVTHGANAVTGILNIITKKFSIEKWNISLGIQEETVGNEFALFDKGRHIQTFKFSHNYKNKWYISAGLNRNDFQGFFDTKKGKFYFENDGHRGLRWLPKEQFNATAMLAYSAPKFNFNYKFEFFNELIDFYNSTVQSAYSDQLGSYRYSNDKRYFVNRYFHNANLTGKLFSKINYSTSFSLQNQERVVEDFRYNLFTKQESNNSEVKDQSMQVFYSTGSLSNFFNNEKANLQLGYEVVLNKGFAVVQEANNTFVPVEKNINNYDVFVSSELKLTDRFSVRPGLRFSVQSLFENQYASSLGLRYLLNKGLEIRSSYGTSFRTPNFNELYSKQIFDGHFFTGNENLMPELSTSYEASIKKSTTLKEDKFLSNQISGSFIDLKDKIDMALVRFNPDTGSPEYQYINISKYKVFNIATTNQFKSKNWSINLGASFTGISQKIENLVFVSTDKYLYSFNWNTSLSYTFPKAQTTLSVYYKYNGKTQQFIEGSSEYIISTIDASNWLDATLQKKFFKGKIETTIGARNIFNVTNINQTGTTQANGHAMSSQLMLAYGRSYFIKLMYNLNF